MPQAAPTFDLPSSLDAVHRRVREAFRHRDLAAYARHLAEDLTYVDAKARVQNRRALLDSLQMQFARLVSFGSRFDRESLVLEDGDVVETGTQISAIALRVLFVLEVRWRVTRHGRYTWHRNAAVGWVLRHVMLDHEQIRREGVGLAGHAAYRDAPE